MNPPPKFFSPLSATVNRISDRYGLNNLNKVVPIIDILKHAQREAGVHPTGQPFQRARFGTYRIPKRSKAKRSKGSKK